METSSKERSGEVVTTSRMIGTWGLGGWGSRALRIGAVLSLGSGLQG